METKLLKLVQGVGKNAKTYFQIHLLVGNETIKAFIWEDQFNSIVASLTEQEKKSILVIKNGIN